MQKVVTLGQREIFIKINNIKEKCMNTYTYFDLKIIYNVYTPLAQKDVKWFIIKNTHTYTYIPTKYIKRKIGSQVITVR